MHEHIVIVENSRITISYKVIKILCLNVLNDDNMLVHKICKYIGFIHSPILNMGFINRGR